MPIKAHKSSSPYLFSGGRNVVDVDSAADADRDLAERARLGDRRAFEMLAVLLVGYLALVLSLSAAVRLLEHRLQAPFRA